MRSDRHSPSRLLIDADCRGSEDSQYVLEQPSIIFGPSNSSLTFFATGESTDPQDPKQEATMEIVARHLISLLSLTPDLSRTHSLLDNDGPH